MRIESKDAIEMYARMCRARYGKRAHRVVQDKLKSLHSKGDTEGVKVWTELAEKLDAPKDHHRHHHHHR